MFIQVILLQNTADVITLPCPPADPVQEDLWGRGSPETQSPPETQSTQKSTREVTQKQDNRTFL